ncbi:MAG: class I SAM-dependent methyltransferase [Treponema sp.]|nr:class I SAM-dependent methyltransferase [Treponema sp.]
MTKTLDYYNNNTAAFVESTQSVLMTEAWSRFTSKLPKGSVILDFGCGSGRDTKYFLEHGYQVEAIDGSEELCKVASGYTGIKVKNQLFTDLSEMQKYDAVWACSSILHASSSDLIVIMKKIWTALKFNGILYASFKYGNFEGERNGRYFTDFTDESFSSLLKKSADFDMIEEWITNDVRPGRENEKWLNVILQKK